MAEKWMAEAFKKKGALHEELGVAKDKPIPMKKVSEAQAHLTKKREGGSKLSPEEGRLSRRLALAKRAKTGDISRMGEGGVVVPFEDIFGAVSPYDTVSEKDYNNLIAEGIGK